MESYKCGFCCWLINTQCDNYLKHKCFTFFNVDEHDLVTNNNNVLTIENVEAETPSETQNLADVDELIIALVAERRALYDFKLPLLQRTKAKKQDLWNEISNNIGSIDIEGIKGRWKYLRDCYVRAKRKVNEYKPSGSQAISPPDPKFKYYDLMKFLDDTEEINNSTISSFDLPSPAPSTSLATTEIVSNMKSTLGSTQKKRKSGDAEINTKILEILAEPIAPPQSPSGLDGFLTRLGEALSRLSYRKRAELEINFLQMAVSEEDI